MSKIGAEKKKIEVKITREYREMVYKMCKMQEILHLKPVYFFSLLKREKKHVCVCVYDAVCWQSEKKNDCWFLTSLTPIIITQLISFFYLFLLPPFAFSLLYCIHICFAMPLHIVYYLYTLLYYIDLDIFCCARTLTHSLARSQKTTEIIESYISFVMFIAKSCTINTWQK